MAFKDHRLHPMKFHFALPSPGTYLDRIHAFIEADSACTIWTLRSDKGLPETIQRHLRLAAGRPIHYQLGRLALWWHLRNVGLDDKPTVLYSLFGLFDFLFRHVRHRRNVLKVHFSVSPSPSWFHGNIVPPEVRDPELLAVRRQNISMEQRAQRYADLVIVQANAYQNVFAESYGKPVADYQTIPNAVVAHRWIDSNAPAVQPWLDLASKHPCLIYVGNIWRFKGILHLLHAFAQVQSETRLLIVGDIRSEAMRKEIESILSAQSLQGRVHLAGRMPQSQIYALMQASRGLVMPTYLEGMPRVVLEAMDLGVPVGASSINGIRDIDPEGEAIIFYEPGDVEAMVAAMQLMLKAGPDIVRRTELGKHIIESNHRPEVIGCRIRQHCEAALAGMMYGKS